MSVVSASLRARVRSSIERPVARVFSALHLSPNALTLIGFAIACLGAWLAAMQAWLPAGLVVGFGAIFDLFDGALARATNKTSNFGAFLDSTMDRAGEAVVYIGIAYAAVGWTGWGLGGILAITALAAAFMVSYTRAKSESLGFAGGSGMASVGLAPREVRTAILVVGLFLTDIAGGIAGVPLWAGSPNWNLAGGRLWLVGTLALITLLATFTTIQRILFTYNQSRSQTQEVDH